MMNTLNEDNYRYELKFLLTNKWAQILKYRLSFIMDKDSFSISPSGEYYIRSLYYDDVYNTAYYEKIDGMFEREKYRIRFYNFDDSFISLELKGKKGNLSYKKRDTISKEEYLLIKNLEFNKIELNDRKVLKDFIKVIKTRNIRPSVIVDYKRLAYTYKFEDVRITFDENIKSGRFNCDLFNKDIPLYDVLENGDIILEVKYNNRLPGFINDVIKTVPMIRIAISKFALCTECKEV